MYKGKKILGIITARGGSKGIPGKNIKPLCGKPLIAYTIEVAQKSMYLTRCIVSTDDDAIAETSRIYGADIPFMRPFAFAQDTSTSMDVIQHALDWCKTHGETYDYCMVLQPTSPLRTSEDIDVCIQRVVDTDADSVMSMVELNDFSIKKLKTIDEQGIIHPLESLEGKQSDRRQDMEKIYKRNGAIYLTKISCLEQSDLFGNISRGYVMPYERSVDINTMIDFELAEFFMKKQQ